MSADTQARFHRLRAQLDIEQAHLRRLMDELKESTDEIECERLLAEIRNRCSTIDMICRSPLQ